MKFGDIFRKSFLQAYEVDFTRSYILSVMCITLVLALYIFFIYRIVNRNTFYSKTMNISLAGIAVITSAIILSIQSSLVISLGMVGALSIVRFRTAIKSPMDLMFLFWSISVGIICGAGLAEVAIIMSLILTVAIFGLNALRVGKAPMMLIVNAKSGDYEEQIMASVKKYAKHHKVKSRTYNGERLDMVVELRLRDERECVSEVSKIEGVTTASLLSHDGEVTF